MSAPGKSSKAPAALADLLDRSPIDAGRRRELRRQLRAIALPVVIVATLLGAWVAAAPLAGAIVAPAQVKVELNRKTVQHQEGGIVREILVRDGQRVRAGDPLLVIGDVRHEGELGVLQDQWRAARARVLRAQAQSVLAPGFDVPAELERDAAEHVARERALLAAQRRSLEEQGALLHGQAREAQAQVEALQAQIDATQVAVGLSDEEVALNDNLVRQGFISRARQLTLQRTAADYRSRIGEYRAALAAARQRIAELHGRAAQLRLTYQTQATDELKEASARVRELEERVRSPKDQVERQIVRAPVDGEVMSLRVTAVGAAVAPREPLLDVVPSREKLVIDARIAPQDIEHVHAGAAAEVRFVGTEGRQLPSLPATVAFVSADRVSQPESGQSWFDVTVEVDAAALQRQPSLRLRPGMPAELYVATGERTLFEYLAQPLGVFTRRALREP